MNRFPAIFFCLLLVSCGTDPYSGVESGRKVYYTSYSDEPKHLDPAVSYYAYEAAIIDSIYDCLYQYHYLKRPYVLEPGLADSMPERSEYTVEGEKTARIVYTIRLKKGVLYHDDECFPYSDQWQGYTRQVVAEDYVNAFRRIADPRGGCPIKPTLAAVVRGLDEFAAASDSLPATDFTLPISGVRAPDPFTLEIELLKPYPQIVYWLAMHFTSPIPIEAIRHYDGKNGRPTLDRHPVGTGPYFLKSWEPRLRIVMEKNARYRDERYPSEGEEGDAEKGLLRDAGKPMPFLDAITMTYETEQIPRWRKFLQGWYDMSGLAKESFDRAVRQDRSLSDEMKAKGMTLHACVEPTIYYFAFNMKDPVVGGLEPKKQKLRQALSLAFDVPTFLRIFTNGRGIHAQEYVPPGITGHGGDTNPFAGVDIERAKKLLAEAGYPDGVDPETKKPLIITYDNASNRSEDRPELQFIQDQFGKLGIRLELRTTDLNTYRKKQDEGNYQICRQGWQLDYPDPENMLFLLHGPQAKVGSGGENIANYVNPEYDRLYEKIASMENSPERTALIAKMTDILRKDAPWIPLFFRETFSLTHAWALNFKEGPILNNVWKYRNIDGEVRDRYRAAENKVQWWPLVLLAFVFGAATAAALRAVRGRE